MVTTYVYTFITSLTPSPSPNNLPAIYPDASQEPTQMANPEHVEILSQGVKAWNAWRHKHLDTLPDLEGATLGGAYFHAAYFRGSILINANLSGSILRLANFGNADLSGADIRGADLSGADLSGAILRGAILTGAILRGANLRAADIHAANLSDADIRAANLSGANLSSVNVNRVFAHRTVFDDVDLRAVEGLESIVHDGPSGISISTIYRSEGRIPELFLRGCGVPESFIVQIPALVAAVQPVEFYSCFISYSSKDKDFAERLHADLRARRVFVWFAPHDLPVGARIRPAIDESIRVHDKLLLVLSENSIGSQWVEQEVETALDREREQEGRTVLFPVRIDGAVMESKAGWPALLKNTRNIGDFTRWKEPDSYQKAFEGLLRDLKAGA
jgi:hypothetical protein